MQNYNTQPLPLISQKPFPYFFLEHLLQGIYGVDAPGLFCASVRLTKSRRFWIQLWKKNKITYASALSGKKM